MANNIDPNFAQKAYRRGFGPGRRRGAALGYPIGIGADTLCTTPGRKKRSKGRGRGLGRGKGLGPMGIPVGYKF